MDNVDRWAPCLVAETRGTFAFATVSERWPKILGKIVDHFHRQWPRFIKEYGHSVDGDVKSVIGALSELTYRVATNKPLTDIDDEFHDCAEWNTLLAKRRTESDELTWFKTEWLFAECYLYRRIFGAVYKTVHLQHYDWFAEQKNEGLEDHIAETKELIHFLQISSAKGLSAETVREDLIALLKISLWGNRCDLSLSGGDKAHQTSSPVRSAASRDQFILANALDEVVDYVILPRCRRIDVILDNAGFELLGDFLLAEFLISHNFADRIFFHGKEYPWFVSDVVQSDITWLLERLKAMDDCHCNEYGKLWTKRFEEGTFVYKASPFWTSSHPYCDMKEATEELYSELSESSLLIFKGDLSYRKLVGDRQWPLTTSFKTALRGFSPAPLLALRTLKAETVAGLSEGTVEHLKNSFGDNIEWMVTGDYAVAQFSK